MFYKSVTICATKRALFLGCFSLIYQLLMTVIGLYRHKSAERSINLIHRTYSKLYKM